MTVAENVGFPLKVQRFSRKETRETVDEMLTLVGLEGFADRSASKLSGGQMQRVALARSLAMRPAVLLLDEPLSNLDAKLRDRLRFELKAIQLQTGITSIFVTHDQREALALADRIAIMRDGKIVQLDEPKNMYRDPNSAFVADFLGATNIFDGRVVGSAGESQIDVDLGKAGRIRGKAGSDTSQLANGNPVVVAIRPEIIQIAPAGQATVEVNQWPGRVQVASFLGSQLAYRLEMESGLILEAVTTDTATAYRTGDAILATMRPEYVTVLPAG
jgi:iron(III) transport system ATP-binding protein